VTVEGETAETGVNFSVHELLTSLHDLAESLPPPVVDQTTVPEGDDPVTVALHSVGVPTTAGAHETDVPACAIGATNMSVLSPRFPATVAAYKSKNVFPEAAIPW
jgi:hypothetical protein